MRIPHTGKMIKICEDGELLAYFLYLAFAYVLKQKML